MTERFYADQDGNYLGAFFDAEPPSGAVEIPIAPSRASDIWNGVIWVAVQTPEIFLPLSARQLRLGLLKIGVRPSQVDAAINALPAEQREAAEIEWAYASEYQRDHYLIGLLAGSFGLTSAQVDAAWKDAEAL